jgi:hypothetical protein
VADSIPQGYRLALRGIGQQAVRKRTNATEAKNLLVSIHNMLRLYNARVSRLPLHERQALDLTTMHFAQQLDGTAVIVHHDSPQWCVSTKPAPRACAPHIGTSHYVRPFHPASRAELRQYFLRKGGDPREAWRRFPPSDAAERAEAERMSGAPRRRPGPPDPFERLVAKRARAAGQNPSDPAFRAKIKAEQDALDALLESII